MKPTRTRPQKIADLAALLALVCLVFVVWSVLDATPLAIVIGMTAGQAVGTASLALFVAAIVLELSRR